MKSNSFVSRLRTQIVDGKKSINRLTEEEKNEVIELANKYMRKDIYTNEELEEVDILIHVLLDYYTYHENGDVLISDHDYDLLMVQFLINGGKPITTADIIEGKNELSSWKFVKHEMPGMVGSVKKIYDEFELYRYVNSVYGRDGIKMFRIAPKFDGISSAIKIDGNGNLLLAITRNDGMSGQNITKLVKNCKNISDILDKYSAVLSPNQIVWIKTELVMSTKDFNQLIEEKSYANRRSATSGIVNTPKNIEFGRFITIIPLASYYVDDNRLDYHPLNSYIVESDSPKRIMQEIQKMLSIIRDSNYPYRTDGVVLFPLDSENEFNPYDIMDHAIAFKVNTNEALTTVEYGYVSLGVLGYARPMIHVKPVEVNETIVQDVSLGSFDVFASMDLHEGEQVLVYSAGDVIPQAKIPDQRYYKTNAKLIKIKKKCPYCNTKLVRNKGTYRCENQECVRVITGKIINFITKLKIKDVSDATINDLYEAGLIKTIPDIFSVTEEDIARLDRYGEKSAHHIVEEFQKIRTREVTVSELLGALGIRGMSTKKCKLIMNALQGEYKRLFKKKPSKLYYDLIEEDGIGEKLASLFIDFLEENQSLLEELFECMNIVIDRIYTGNVVFTGFRDSDLEKKFNDLGFEVSNNINKQTIVLIDASVNHDSTKCNQARSKRIDIIHRSEVDKVFQALKNGYGK